MEHSRYETLYAFCQAMEWAVDPESVYQRIVDVSAEYLECDAAHLHLLDIGGKSFARHASHLDGSLPEAGAPVTANVGRMASLMNHGQLIVMEDYEHPHAEDVIPAEAVELGYRSAISIPLQAPSGVLGMLSIVYRSPLPWSADDRDFLLQIGRVLGTLVQRVQMSKKEVELQVLRDRKQLSSEIHDNVAQMVSALAIRADTAIDCLEGGDYAALQDGLAQMAEQARQATKVLREEMLSLRASYGEESDVEANLRGIFARFESQWGIPVRFDSRCIDAVLMSDYGHLQLSRIVNECLQNILRHARADSVCATLDRRNGSVLISIRDDGIGFDVDAVSPERLGLRIMRERAESAGGEVSITSGKQGTTVFIEMPAARG